MNNIATSADMSEMKAAHKSTKLPVVLSNIVCTLWEPLEFNPEPTKLQSETGRSDPLELLMCFAGDANPVPEPSFPRLAGKVLCQLSHSQGWRSHAQKCPDTDKNAVEAAFMSAIMQAQSRPAKRNPTSWTPVEDQQLILSVMQNGTRCWSYVASAMQTSSQGEIDRTGKQCRERWHNHLDPTLRHDPFSSEEDQKLIRLQRTFYNKWTEISKRMPGRSDNAVKNRWNSCLFKQALSDSLVGAKRSAEPISEEQSIFYPIMPLEERFDDLKDDAVNSKFPCAVRSMLKTHPHDVAETESSGIVPSVAVDQCLADQCFNAAQYGFRKASGQVRRTRCMAHHEAGMYVCTAAALSRSFRDRHYAGFLIRQPKILQ
jgi:hypothetical protein